MASHTLKKGHYVICDPAYIVKKNNEGQAYFNKLIDAFYRDANKFHHLTFDDVELYVCRSLGGDGLFDGVATDTGLFVIVETNQLKNDSRFRQSYTNGYIKTFDVETEVDVSYENFDLSISNGIFIHTE